MLDDPIIVSGIPALVDRHFVLHQGVEIFNDFGNTVKKFSCHISICRTAEFLALP